MAERLRALFLNHTIICVWCRFQLRSGHIGDIAKDSQILSTKNNNVFVIFMFEILTNCYLMTSLILNNWAQYYRELKSLA